MAQRRQRMRHILCLEDQPFVGEIGKFEQNPFSLASRVGKSIKRNFFPTRGESHTEIILNKLEVPVVVTKEGGSVSAFS